MQDKYGADYTLEDEEDEEEDLSDDDSDAELVTPQVDVAILRTLARIRQKDPLVYEENRSVFQGELHSSSIRSLVNNFEFKKKLISSCCRGGNSYDWRTCTKRTE